MAMPDQIEPGKAKSAGICGIIIGIIGFALFIVGCLWASYGGDDGNGIWCGFLLLLQFALGMVAWLKLNKLAMVFYLVLAILNIILCIVQAAIAALAWLIWAILKGYILTQCSDATGICICTGKEPLKLRLDKCDDINTIESFFITMLIVAGIGTVVCFASSIIGCMATCCASQPATTNVVVVQQPAAVGVAHAPPPDQQAYPMQ